VGSLLSLWLHTCGAAAERGEFPCLTGLYSGAASRSEAHSREVCNREVFTCMELNLAFWLCISRSFTLLLLESVFLILCPPGYLCPKRTPCWTLCIVWRKQLDMHDVSGVGSSPVFKWLVVIILTLFYWWQRWGSNTDLLNAGLDYCFIAATWREPRSKALSRLSANRKPMWHSSLTSACKCLRHTQSDQLLFYFNKNSRSSALLCMELSVLQ
jgi:hypothetical protein